MGYAPQQRFIGIMELSAYGCIRNSGYHCRTVSDHHKFFHKIIQIYLVPVFMTHQTTSENMRISNGLLTISIFELILDG